MPRPSDWASPSPTRAARVWATGVNLGLGHLASPSVLGVTPCPAGLPGLDWHSEALRLLGTDHPSGLPPVEQEGAGRAGGRAGGAAGAPRAPRLSKGHGQGTAGSWLGQVWTPVLGLTCGFMGGPGSGSLRSTRSCPSQLPHLEGKGQAVSRTPGRGSAGTGWTRPGPPRDVLSL